ncbi:response regulator [Pseudoroseicyclus sp. CXY001]|uniref:response regulator n=1 Tax=Pseudoroseicyclus sp. CXY001 TaxID=3242492 RepID=UPI00357178FE
MPAATILIVDDDPVCVMAVERTLKRMALPNPVVSARSAPEALDMLAGTNGRERLRRPVLILLDISMVPMSGIDMLDELRADPDLHSTVVFMLSSSDAPKDVEAAHARNVAGYLMKGASPEEFRQTMELIERYLDQVPLPG